MAARFDDLDSLENQLSKLSTDEDKLSLLKSLMECGVHDATSTEPVQLLPGGVNPSDPLGVRSQRSSQAIDTHFVNDNFDALREMAAKAIGVHSLSKFPCANVHPGTLKCCQNEGRSACGSCKLVAYCSKSCQKEHWSIHKQDCKDQIRSPDWKPAWVIERREASFMQGRSTDPNWHLKLDFIAQSRHLWGNIPAYDILNIPNNGKETNRDYSIAIPASGDLRNIIRTINGLEPSFSGHLTIIMNDREPYIVVRNILLLMILGSALNVNDAANLALHFWYSAFVPFEYLTVISAILLDFLSTGNEGVFSCGVGQKTTISGVISPEVVMLMSAMMTSKYEVGDVSNELHRIRFEPSRIDRHHRRYGRLEPSHRLASLEFRRFGLVLPFGARNDRFNTPNRFLFSPQGKWLQDDLADPLESWNISDVVDAGRQCGVLRGDLYGCLYFYLRDQLQSFAERLRKFKVSFRFFDLDAADLASHIKSGVLENHGVPNTMLFDRVDVSNILDFEYLGIPRVLSDWGPLLSTTKHATLVGYFMNWPNRQIGGNLNSIGKGVINKITDQMMDDGKILKPKAQTMTEMRDFAASIPVYLNSQMVYYDNSEAFQKYLGSHGMPEALRQSKLKVKINHTVVPHRIGAPLDGPANALLTFADAESWYLNVCVGHCLWSERFIELVRT